MKVDWNRWVDEDDSDDDSMFKWISYTFNLFQILVLDYSSLPNFNSFGSGYESDDEEEEEEGL